MDQQLPAGHPARWIEQYVDKLDLSELRDVYAGRGSDAYPPEKLFKIALLETLESRLSPAQWYRDCRLDIAVRWLAMGLEPSRTVLYDFRDRFGRVIDRLNEELVRTMQSRGLIRGDKTVHDGTILRACASRHRLQHMETVQRHLAELEQAVQQDEKGLAVERSGRWMAPTVSGRVDQLGRHRKAEEQLRERLLQNAKRPSDKRLPEKRVLISVSDPEAALGRDKEKVFCPCYCPQCVTDLQSLVIVSYDVAARASDAGTLIPMLERTRRVLGTFPQYHVVDAGYLSILDLKECGVRNVNLIAPVQENDLSHRRPRRKSPQLGKDAFTWQPQKQVYLCPQGHELVLRQRRLVHRSEGRRLMHSLYRCPPVHCQTCPLSQQCCRNPKTGRTLGRLDGEELLQEHRLKMKTPIATQLKRMRGSIIERVFADFKEHRGLRRLHGRGLSRAKAEVGLAVFAYNLQRWHALEKQRNSLEDTS